MKPLPLSKLIELIGDEHVECHPLPDTIRNAKCLKGGGNQIDISIVTDFITPGQLARGAQTHSGFVIVFPLDKHRAALKAWDAQPAPSSEPCVMGIYCREHKFVHGAEAEELRGRFGELAETWEDGDIGRADIQRILDDVDARDSVITCDSVRQGCLCRCCDHGESTDCACACHADGACSWTGGKPVREPSEAEQATAGMTEIPSVAAKGGS